jgi:hypothetical protein
LLLIVLVRAAHSRSAIKMPVVIVQLTPSKVQGPGTPIAPHCGPGRVINRGLGSAGHPEGHSKSAMKTCALRQAPNVYLYAPHGAPDCLCVPPNVTQSARVTRNISNRKQNIARYAMARSGRWRDDIERRIVASSCRSDRRSRGRIFACRAAGTAVVAHYYLLAAASAAVNLLYFHTVVANHDRHRSTTPMRAGLVGLRLVREWRNRACIVRSRWFRRGAACVSPVQSPVQRSAGVTPRR